MNRARTTLERAFYPRQAVIDKNAATLVTGDYDHTKDLTVSNSVKMFKVDAASLETIGGPNSNNYKEILHLTMGSDSFDKVFIGSAEDAAKAETTTDITERKADLDCKSKRNGRCNYYRLSRQRSDLLFPFCKEWLPGMSAYSM